MKDKEILRNDHVYVLLSKNLTLLSAQYDDFLSVSNLPTLPTTQPTLPNSIYTPTKHLPFIKGVAKSGHGSRKTFAVKLRITAGRSLKLIRGIYVL